MIQECLYSAAVTGSAGRVLVRMERIFGHNKFLCCTGNWEVLVFVRVFPEFWFENESLKGSLPRRAKNLQILL